jgi:hypothetical protein
MPNFLSPITIQLLSFRPRALFPGFRYGTGMVEALLQDPTKEILFDLERAIGQGVGDTAITGDWGRGGGF